MQKIYMSEDAIKVCQRLRKQSRRMDRVWSQMSEKGTLTEGKNMRRVINIQDRIRVRMGIRMETLLLMNSL